MKDYDYLKIKCVNPLHSIISEVDKHIGGKNENNYLVFNSTNENKKVFKKYTELWDGIKSKIAIINDGKSGEYEKHFMKIKFDTDDNSPLSKTLKRHNMAIVTR